MAPGDREGPGSDVLPHPAGLSPAGLSCLQAPLPDSGGPGSVHSLWSSQSAGWEGVGWAVLPPLPHTLRPDHLRIMRSRWPLVSLDRLWLQGLPPARAQPTTTRGWKVRPPQLSRQCPGPPAAGGQRGGLVRPTGQLAARLGPMGHPATSRVCLPATKLPCAFHGTFRRPVDDCL